MFFVGDEMFGNTGNLDKMVEIRVVITNGSTLNSERLIKS